MTFRRITDFSPWDSLDKFSDIEAAYLWNDLEPPIWLHALVNEGCEHPKAVSMTRAFLNQESENGRLTDLFEIREVCFYGMLHKVRGATTYSRKDLRQCAERMNRRPLFLFPEYRQPESPAVSLSDAALGKQQRELLQTFEESNQDRHNARQAEWIRWHTEGRRIQASRTRKCSNSELAKLIKKSLNLTDALSTIRQGLGKAEKLTCQN